MRPETAVTCCAALPSTGLLLGAWQLLCPGLPYNVGSCVEVPMSALVAWTPRPLCQVAPFPVLCMWHPLHDNWQLDGGLGLSGLLPRRDAGGRPRAAARAHGPAGGPGFSRAPAGALAGGAGRRRGGRSHVRDAEAAHRHAPRHPAERRGCGGGGGCPASWFVCYMESNSCHQCCCKGHGWKVPVPASVPSMAPCIMCTWCAETSHTYLKGHRRALLTVSHAVHLQSALDAVDLGSQDPDVRPNLCPLTNARPIHSLRHGLHDKVTRPCCPSDCRCLSDATLMPESRLCRHLDAAAAECQRVLCGSRRSRSSLRCRCRH